MKYKIKDLQRWHERITDDAVLEKRYADYKYLRRHYFTDWEATKICTNLTKPDKDGVRYLAALNLQHTAWQSTIKDRVAWHDKKIIYYMRKGLNRRQANRAIQNEIEDFLSTRTGDTRQDNTAWSGIREYYRIKPSDKGDIDFMVEMKKRQASYSKKKLPYAVAKS